MTQLGAAATEVALVDDGEGVVTLATASITTFPRPAGCGRRHRRAADSDALDAIVGESAAIHALKTQVRRTGPASVPVLLVGESGTGKELVAQAIHAQSPRHGGPFVAVNCGAIPTNLVEAELFGYDRGAFTGAVRQHAGYFERARGGTLFLDEIGEMPLELQPKLLRALETGWIVRVGGREEIDVDVRIIAATNRDPRIAVAAGRLRDDLLYRLAVLEIELPPLRDRDDDVELLADAFLARLNAEHGTAKRFAPQAYESMREHSWPGNVRELANCIARSFVMCDDVVDVDIRAAPAARPPGPCVHLAIGTSVADAERQLLLATLDHCGGNKRRAAQLLGVSLKTVYNKLAGYNGHEVPLPVIGGD